MIGVGIVTYRRPEFFEVCARSIVGHLGAVADEIVAIHDGPQIERYDTCPVPLDNRYANRGVGTVKNDLLRTLMGRDCGVLFIAEDDIEIDSVRAVTGYVEAMKVSGVEHLMFHGHGPANLGHHPSVDGAVSYWPACVGAWSCYTVRAINVGGLMDEHFVNAWDHVEHTMRLATLGLTSQYPRFADATGSEAWLHEQASSDVCSVIRPRDDWQANIERGKDHWRSTHPETYRLLGWP